MPTLIRKDQLRIDEFIQALASADWTSDTLTASAAAIAAKIQDSIAGASGAMVYRGAWSTAATDTIKAGFVYVYDGNGTAPTGVTLENGDTLIAKQDNASVTNANHWTVVQVNITGAVTTANFLNTLLSFVESGNTNSLTLDVVNNKLVFTVKFPSITGGTPTPGQYVSGLSINAATGAMTVIKDTLPSLDFSRIVFHGKCDGTCDGVNTSFLTPEAALESPFAFYINGVKQTPSVDYDTRYNIQSGLIEFGLLSGAYIPKAGDQVSCSYIRQS